MNSSTKQDTHWIFHILGVYILLLLLFCIGTAIILTGLVIGSAF